MSLVLAALFSALAVGWFAGWGWTFLLLAICCVVIFYIQLKA